MIKRDAPHDYEVLEVMIDKHGLSMVLKAVSEICEDLGKFILVGPTGGTRPTRDLARRWTCAGKRVWSCASSSSVKAVK